MNVRNGSSPASRKYLNRGCAVASGTTTGFTCSATSPARPSVMRMRTCPTLSGRRPTVAASTRLARSGSSRYTEQTSVAQRSRISVAMLDSVSEGLPFRETSRPISSSVRSGEPGSWTCTAAGSVFTGAASEGSVETVATGSKNAASTSAGVWPQSPSRHQTFQVATNSQSYIVVGRLGSDFWPDSRF